MTTIFRENLSVVDGPSNCLEDDLFTATPAWPTPMRALMSKLNVPTPAPHLPRPKPSAKKGYSFLYTRTLFVVYPGFSTV